MEANIMEEGSMKGGVTQDSQINGRSGNNWRNSSKLTKSILMGNYLEWSQSAKNTLASKK